MDRWLPVGTQRRLSAQLVAGSLTTREAMLDVLDHMISVGTVIKVALEDAEMLSRAQTWGEMMSRTVL